MQLQWDQTGERLFETGVDRGVVYPYNTATNAYDAGYAWSGLTGVTESPSGAEASPFYADNIKYLNLYSAEELGATVTAYSFPKQFQKLDGTAEIAPGVTIGQQNRGLFGMTYRTKIGSDTEGNDKGYKLHLLYGAMASPSEKGYTTINDSPEPIEFSWELNTTPVNVTGFKPTALLTVDSTSVDADKLAAFEAVLYGTDGVVSYNEITSPTGNPATNGYYERSGSDGAYVYTATTDATVDSLKTYYEKVTTGGTSARLPLPDEVATLLGTVGAQG